MIKKISGKIPTTIIRMLIIPFSFIISSCSSGEFMKPEDIGKLEYFKEKKNQVIYYHKEYLFTEKNTILAKTKKIIKILSNDDINNYFQEFDGDMFKLLSFQIRITKNNGDVVNFGNSDVLRISLNGKSQISNSRYCYIPASEQVSLGDIIEIITLHENQFSNLGIIFNLIETGRISSNISLSIIIPKGLNLNYKILNDKREPLISESEKGKEYTFSWPKFQYNEDISKFSKTNPYPEIFASCEFAADINENKVWNNYGNWFLELISSRLIVTDEIKLAAESITKNCNTPKEKIDAIFEYCQKNIRYEISYLEYGEIIPNDCGVILKRKYGDCKDYSIIIYNMAKSLGIDAEIVLCFRGRGREFVTDIPVSQFNHMIVHCKFEGKDYWYDGTNRVGIPGITSTDLVNQYGLVLKKDASSLIKIEEYKENLLKISGELKLKDNNFAGNLTFDLQGQYSIDMAYANIHLNKEKMNNYILKLLRETLNDNIEINVKNIRNNNKTYAIDVFCKIPNAVLKLDSNYYTSYSRLMPELIPFKTEISKESLYYYPYYNNIEIDLKLSGNTISGQNIDYRLNHLINIPCGPFNENEKEEFIKIFSETQKKLSKNIQISGNRK